MGRQSFMKSR